MVIGKFDSKLKQFLNIPIKGIIFILRLKYTNWLVYTDPSLLTLLPSDVGFVPELGRVLHKPGGCVCGFRVCNVDKRYTWVLDAEIFIVGQVF